MFGSLSDGSRNVRGCARVDVRSLLLAASRRFAMRRTFVPVYVYVTTAELFRGHITFTALVGGIGYNHRLVPWVMGFQDTTPFTQGFGCFNTGREP